MASGYRWKSEIHEMELDALLEWLDRHSRNLNLIYCDLTLSRAEDAQTVIKAAVEAGFHAEYDQGRSVVRILRYSGGSLQAPSLD